MSNIEFTRQKIDANRLPPSVIAKWSADILDEGFVPFPKKFLRCLPKIFNGNEGIYKLTVILAAVDFQREKLSREPSIAYLAFLADMPTDKFSKILDELQKENLIAVTPTESGIKIDLSGLLKRIKEVTTRDSDVAQWIEPF